MILDHCLTRIGICLSGYLGFKADSISTLRLLSLLLLILRLTFCHEHEALSSILTFGAI